MSILHRFIAWARQNQPAFWLIAALILGAAVLALVWHALAGTL